jgi:hypothetical protein
MFVVENACGFWKLITPFSLLLRLMTSRLKKSRKSLNITTAELIEVIK